MGTDLNRNRALGWNHGQDSVIFWNFYYGALLPTDITVPNDRQEFIHYR